MSIVVLLHISDLGGLIHIHFIGGVGFGFERRVCPDKATGNISNN